MRCLGNPPLTGPNSVVAIRTQFSKCSSVRRILHLTSLTLWSPEFCSVQFSTSKKTHHISISVMSWLAFFKEMIDVCSGNHTKVVNTRCGQNAYSVNGDRRIYLNKLIRYCTTIILTSKLLKSNILTPHFPDCIFSYVQFKIIMGYLIK